MDQRLEKIIKSEIGYVRNFKRNCVNCSFFQSCEKPSGGQCTISGIGPFDVAPDDFCSRYTPKLKLEVAS